MKLERDDRSKVGKRYLYLAYGIAGAGVFVGAWRGWLTPKSPLTTELVPAVVLVLIPRTPRRPFQSALCQECVELRLGVPY